MLHRPEMMIPDVVPAATARPGKIDRRTAISLGIMTATFGALSVLVGGHGGHHHDEDRKRQANAHHPERAGLERIWHEGFIDRGGEQLMAAMRENLKDPRALQTYLDGQRLGEGLVPLQALFRCMDDRICACGSCSAGSLVLDSDRKGGALYVPPAEVAQRVLASPVVARTGNGPIVYTKHAGGCGGDRIAMGIAQGRDAARISNEEVESWGVSQGRAVTDALRTQLAGAREVEFRQLGFGNRAMQGPQREHAGQVIYVTAHRTRQLDPRFSRLPVGMQLDGLALNESNLALNMGAGVRILLEHGPQREPILVVGLAEPQFRDQLAAVLERTARNLPGRQRESVLLGTAAFS